MRNLNMYGIWDSKAFAFLQPFFLPTNDMAIRTFGDACRDTRTEFGKHPADYTLFLLGRFSIAEGHYTEEENGKLVLANGIELIAKADNPQQLSIVKENVK